MEAATEELRKVVESPFLRSHLDGMVGKILQANSELPQDISQRQGYAVLDSLISMHKGKFVCLFTLADNEADKTEYRIDNLVADYRESSDVVLVFVADSLRMTQDRFDDIRHSTLEDYAYCYRLTPNEYAQLALLAGNAQGSFSSLTLDREGKQLRQPLSLDWSSDSETMFRRDLRQLLKGQSQKVQYSLY